MLTQANQKEERILKKEAESVSFYLLTEEKEG